MSLYVTLLLLLLRHPHFDRYVIQHSRMNACFAGLRNKKQISQHGRLVSLPSSLTWFQEWDF